LKNTSYDETPTNIRLADVVPGEDITVPAAEGDGRVRASRSASGTKQKHTARGNNKPKTAKVLQTEASLSILVKDPSGNYLHFSGAVPSWLQVLDHTTGENIAAAIGDTWNIKGLGEMCGRFPAVIGLSTCDRGGSNMRYEKCAAKACGATENHLTQLCFVHRCSSVATCLNTLLGTDVSRLTSLALSQRAAGSLDILRKCVLLWVTSNLKVYRGASPPALTTAASKRREAMLNLVFPSPCEDRATLSHILNGDWQSWEIQH
jgi:hypothetical protein